MAQVKHCERCERLVQTVDGECRFCLEEAQVGAVLPLTRLKSQELSAVAVASARAQAAPNLSEPEAVDSTGSRPLRTAAPVVPLRPPRPPKTMPPGEPVAPTVTASSAEPDLAAAGPPVLASDLLAEDIRPTEPWDRISRIAVISTAVLGVCALLLAPTSMVSVAGAVCLILGGAAGAIPLSYSQRAIASLSLGIGSLTAGVLISSAGSWPRVLLAVALCLAIGGLVFRAHYRGARAGRIVTGVGVLLCSTWVTCVLAGWTGDVVNAAFAVGWVQTSLIAVFVALVMLSLLVFMNESTTGGATVWAGGFVLWFALFLTAAVTLRSDSWDESRMEGAAAMVQFGGTLMVAVAIFQALVVLAGGTKLRRAMASSA